jgi:hypothetical protein
MSTDEDILEICQAIEKARSQVVEEALADQYRNPFWDDRYAERGRTHSRKDNNYHLDFLITALRLDTPSTFYDYIAWLRPLLVLRGMCTLHLRRNLESLFGHLQTALPEQWPFIVPIFAAGLQALNFQNPACRALAAGQEQIARDASRRMWLSDPAWEQKYGERGPALFVEDNLYHISYLQDAVSLEQPALFGKYVAWFSGFLGRQGISPASLYHDLAILAQEIGQALPASEAGPFLALLAERALQ